MASLSSATKLCKFVVKHTLLFITFSIMHVSSREILVGGREGWAKPSANHNNTYNQWAKQQYHIFVGDTISFRYRHNDSVLEVKKEDYEKCNISKPITVHKGVDDGNSSRITTNITLQNYGCYYFVSGIPNNCQAGEKMSLFVVVPDFSGGFPPFSIEHTDRICMINEYDNNYHFHPTPYVPPVWMSSTKRVTATYSGLTFSVLLNVLLTLLSSELYG